MADPEDLLYLPGVTTTAFDALVTKRPGEVLWIAQGHVSTTWCGFMVHWRFTADHAHETVRALCRFENPPPVVSLRSYQSTREISCGLHSGGGDRDSHFDLEIPVLFDLATLQPSDEILLTSYLPEATYVSRIDFAELHSALERWDRAYRHASTRF